MYLYDGLALPQFASVKWGFCITCNTYDYFTFNFLFTEGILK